MKAKTFQEIREEYPIEFLVLLDPEERGIDPSTIEVVSAKEVHAFTSGEEMFSAYKDLCKRGHKVRFCTPQYTDRFIIQQIPTLGVFGV